jgi:hypothetical protein
VGLAAGALGDGARSAGVAAAGLAWRLGVSVTTPAAGVTNCAGPETRVRSDGAHPVFVAAPRCR